MKPIEDNTRTNYVINAWEKDNPVGLPPIESFIRNQCRIFLKWFDEDKLEFRGRIRIDAGKASRFLEDLFDLVSGQKIDSPGHGRFHVMRVISNALSIASRECSKRESVELLISAMAHDIGRILQVEDNPNLRHAEISGYLLKDIYSFSGEIPNPAKAVALYAVLAHTHERPDYEDEMFRAVDDLRTADKLDLACPIGFLRVMVFHNAYQKTLSLKPELTGKMKTVLDKFDLFVNRLYPVKASKFGKKMAARQLEQSKEIIKIIIEGAGLPEKAMPYFKKGFLGKKSSWKRIMAPVEEIDDKYMDVLYRNFMSLSSAEKLKWEGGMAFAAYAIDERIAELKEETARLRRSGDKAIAATAEKLGKNFTDNLAPIKK